MIHPLIHHPDGALGVKVDGQAVLGEHRQIVGGNQLGDAVVDLRVDVIGTACQNDATLAVLFHPVQRRLTGRTHVGLGLLLFGPCGLDRHAHLGLGNVPFLAALAHQLVGGDFFRGKGHEGTDVAHIPVGNGLHVVFQIFRIGHHDGAVEMVLGGRGLLLFIEHAGVENGLDPLFHQPLHVTVGQLGRVAFRLGGDGFHAQPIEIAVGEGGEHHPEAQLLEEGCPEGEVFIQIEHPGDADDASGSILLLQRRVVKQPLALVGEQIGHVLGSAPTAQTLFAPIAGDVTAAAGEDVDGEHTVVGTAAAPGGGGGICKVVDLLQRQHGGGLTLIPLPCQQRRAEGTHNARNVGAGGLHTGDGLKGPQHRLIVEGAALHHHVGAQLPGISQLDDLEQGVFDDRIGQTGRNIGHLRPLFLCLLHVGVHKHRAAGAQIHRMLGKEGFFCKILCGKAQRIGEVFNKGAAARGTGLVEQHVFHHAALQLDALHVLTADVQHAVHLGVKKGGGGAVGHRFHLALVQTEGRFQQGLAVAGGAGADDAGILGQPLAQLCHGGHGGFDGVALIVGIEGEEQLPLAADQRQLGGGGACVDAQKAVALIGFQIGLGNDGLVVPGAEGVIVGLIPEQRLQPLELKGHLHPLLQLLQQDVQGQRNHSFALQRRTHGGEQVGVFRVNDVFGGQLEGADKGLFQLGQKVQRAAQKGHAAPDGLAAGQTGDGLLYHRLKDGGGKVGLGGTLVDEGLNVGLGKYAAPGGDGIDFLVVFRLFVQAGGIGLQQCGHLVDESAGAAGADAVHALFQTALEIDDFGVLTAQLDGNIGLGCRLLEGRGHRHHLLHEGDAQRLAQIDGARAGNGGQQGAVAQLSLCLLQKGGQRLLGPCAVTHIFSENQLFPLVEQRQLDGGGADVNACAIDVHMCLPNGNQILPEIKVLEPILTLSLFFYSVYRRNVKFYTYYVKFLLQNYERLRRKF